MAKVLRACGMAAMVAVSGCAASHAMEQRGDSLAARGDSTGAATAYHAALEQRPIMDFDYTRIRDKVAALKQSDWSAKLAVEVAKDPTDPLAHLMTLVTFRLTARKEGVSNATVAEIDAAIATAADPQALGARGDITTGLTKLDALVAAITGARDLEAPQLALDALVAAIQVRITAGVPRPGPQDALARLEVLIKLRVTLRGLGVPAAVDQSLQALFEQLAGIAVPPVPVEQAPALAKRATELRQQVVTIGAGPAALALTTSALEAALAPVLVETNRLAAEHHYLQAQALLAPAVIAMPEPHPGRTRLAAIITEAAAYYSAQAASHPPGGVHAVLTAMAAMFGASDAVRTSELAALATQWRTQLAVKATFDNPGCASLSSQVALPTDGRPQAVTVHLETCVLGSGTTTESRRKDYATQHQVQIGTHKQLVGHHTSYDTGTHFEDCSASYAVAGESTAKCEKPNAPVQVEDYADVPESQTVDVSESTSYDVEKRTLNANVTGTATTTWEDGTVFTVAIAIRSNETAEGWHLSYPGPQLGDPAIVENHPIDGSFNIARLTSSTVGSVASQIDSLRSQISEHRAKLARAEGVAALAHGDEAAAGEAFVRSMVLVNTGPVAEAAAWMTRALSLSPAEVQQAVIARARVSPDAGHLAPPVVVAYAGGSVKAAETLRAPRTEPDLLKGDSTKSLAIKRPFDHGYVYLGPLPYQVMTASGSRVTTMVGIQAGFSPLSKTTHYGAGLRDDVGYRAGIGYRLGDHEYGNGKQERHLEWSFDGFARLMGGWRNHRVGIYGGASLGWLRVLAADTLAKGWHAEPCAELALRIVGNQNILIDVSGFVTPVSSWGRTDRLSAMLPFSMESALGLNLAYEVTQLNTTSVDESGDTRMDLGTQPVKAFFVQLGGIY